MLIVCDLFWNRIGAEQQSLCPGNPTLHSSKLGWLISRPISICSKPDSITKPILCNFSIRQDYPSLHEELARFWELKSVLQAQPQSEEETLCEQHCLHFLSTEEWPLIPVGSFGLGSWQVYRLQWKLNLIDRMQAKSNAVPIEMPNDFIELNTMEYTPVKVRGEFLHDKEILIGPRALIEEDSTVSRVGSLVSDPKRNQGWLVVTPFKLAESGEVILINRGWIHQNLRPKEKREASFVKGEVELVGVVRLTEKRAPFMPKNHPEKGSWFYRDLEQMSECIGCAPVWLDAKGIPDPPEAWPIPNQTRITLRNEHFSYIVTWYSLSALTAIMWHRYFMRKLPLI